MGEFTKVITQCDVCGRRKKNSLRHLIQFADWTKFQFKKEWIDGIHHGFRDAEIIVCDKCDRTKKANKKFLKKCTNGKN